MSRRRVAPLLVLSRRSARREGPDNRITNFSPLSETGRDGQRTLPHPPLLLRSEAAAVVAYTPGAPAIPASPPTA